VVTTDIKVTV